MPLLLPFQNIIKHCFASFAISLDTPTDTNLTMKPVTVSSSTSSPSNAIYSSSSSKSALGRLRQKLSPRKAKNPSFPSPINSFSTELQNVFNHFDDDGDGKISPAELQRCVRMAGGELSQQEAEAAVKLCDLDGDGLLGFNDFQSLMEGDVSEDDKKDELRQAFGMYETEPGSGCITPTSLKRMLNRLGESRSIDDCKAMIRTFDLNGDGVLNFHEFAVMMS